ncbi:MBL fold metallo-hydrolase [Kamptonema cortianum]|nr:MBL fold metallo-hydrolase [Geitlerinema splendidum]MDK3158769.1 MBL fold metallo-hydrolase [Kamptonema cortianum]
MPERITFHGAAGTVTGSRHLIETNNKKILVDCGLFQGPREIRQKNWQPFPVPVSELDAIVLTHAHTDHIGFLPKLVREGYRGPVYATPGTIGLARVSLPDGGRLQEEEARYHNKHLTSDHEPALPLFTESDAYEALKLLKPVHYYSWLQLPGKANFRFVPAGHILGSAFAEIYFENGERIVMGGDLGRYDRPIIKDPTPVDFGEYLVIESTYGDRLHNHEDAESELEEILTQAARDRSVVIAPSFAIGRTQELLWYLHTLEKKGKLPSMPIYVDSPMATATTLLYLGNEEDHDYDMKVDLSQGKSPFRRDMVTFVRDREMSKQLNGAPGPFVVIAGSGMCTGGRVLHHLKSHLSNPSTILMFTGYQASGTLGRQILEGQTPVRIFKDHVDVRAQIRRLDMLSAHADYEEMLQWLSNFKEPPKKTFIVHGEPPASESLQQIIKERLGWETIIPAQGDSFELA